MQKDFTTLLTRYVPIITGLSLLYGTVQLSTYYSTFNFNIIPYLEINEIIYLSLKEFATFSIGAILYTTLLFYAPSRIWNVHLKGAFSQKSFFRSLKYFNINLIMCILILTSIFIISTLKYFNIIQYETFLIYTMPLIQVLTTFIIFFEFARHYYKNYNILPSLKIVGLTLFTIFCLGMAITDGLINPIRNKKKNKHLKNSVVYLGNIIKSTPNYFYVGRTSKYVFFYNQTEKIMDIFPMDKIDKMSLNR